MAFDGEYKMIGSKSRGPERYCVRELSNEGTSNVREIEGAWDSFHSWPAEGLATNDKAERNQVHDSVGESSG